MGIHRRLVHLGVRVEEGQNRFVFFAIVNHGVQLNLVFGLMDLGCGWRMAIITDGPEEKSSCP
jgi:hypothetical protein